MSIKDPKYPLGEVQTAAKDGKRLSFAGRSQTDAINLGYYESDVAKCLCNLTSANFVKTEEYLSPNKKKKLFCDVYALTCTSPDGEHRDDLYIKFRLSSWLLVVSFHQNRSI